MASDTLRKVASQIVQRTAINFGKYNNPYHPEDNLVNNIDAENDLDAEIDANLEKNNAKFISNADNESDDQLDTEAPNIKRTPVKKYSVENKDNTKLPLYLKLRQPADYKGNTFTIAQRRFKLKGSN